MPHVDRRTLLAAAAAGSLAALAGCSSSCPDSGEPEPDALVETGGDQRPFETPARTDWRAPRADPANTGYAPEAAPPSPPLGVRWRTAVPSADREGTVNRASTPAVVGGLVVVSTGDGVAALHFRDGAEAWHSTAVTPAVTRPNQGFADELAPPVVAADGTAVVAGTDALVGVDLVDGSERWRQPGSFGVPAVREGVAYAVGEDVVAVDVEAGTELWRAPAGPVGGLPAVADGTVVVTGDETRALEAGTGERRWRVEQGADHYPVVADGLVYLGAYEGLHGVGLATGDQRWSFDRGSGRSLSSPVVTPDALYLVEQPGEAGDATFALDRTDGAPEPRWCSDVGEGAVTAAAGDQAFGLVSGVGPGGSPALVAFADRFGDARWGYRSRERLLPAAVVDRAIVVADRAGTVAALGEV